MQKGQLGFTLIELVVVIVILGILAATALPKFVDLSSEAGKAASAGVAGALASSTAINYAAQMANKTSPAPLTGLIVEDVCKATLLQPFLTGVTLVDGATNATSVNSTTYSVSAGTGSCTPASTAAGTAVTCKIIGQYGSSVDATIICGKA